MTNFNLLVYFFIFVSTFLYIIVHGVDISLKIKRTHTPIISTKFSRGVHGITCTVNRDFIYSTSNSRLSYNQNSDHNNNDHDHINKEAPVMAIEKFLHNIYSVKNDIEIGKYANLHPYTENDLVGFLFLVTNLSFLVSGNYYYYNLNDRIFGTIIDVAGLVSLYYHWAQLHYGVDNLAPVTTALYIDYVTAFITVVYFSIDTISSLSQSFPNAVGSIFLSITAICFLLTSWHRDNNFGVRYMVFHGLWHVFSAISTIVLHWR